MENKRKQNIKYYCSIRYNEKDFIKCKTRLDNLSERDLKRVNRFTSSPTYYGDKVLRELIGECDIGVIKHLQTNTLNYIKEKRDYVHGLVDNLNDMIADPKSFDYKEYERVKEILKGDAINSLFFGSDVSELKWCVTCNSKPKLVSSRRVYPECNGSFCSFGNCSKCESYVEEEYGCKCTSEEL